MAGDVRRRAAVLGLLLAAPGLVAGCSESTPDTAPLGSPTSLDPAASVTYAPGLTEDLWLPAETGPAPLVVLVPGGGWTTADPTGLAGLAGRLAEDGIVAATARIRAASDGVVYPAPVEDVLCAVATAVDESDARGFAPTTVAVLGHSSGAHLAALAVLAFDDFAPTCTAPVVEPDALVGLAGPYDIGRVPGLAQPLFATEPGEDPATWEAANPLLRVAERPDVPVLLLHGEDDAVVPVDFTTQLADALEGGGHPTTVELAPGADHLRIFGADVAGAPVADWLRGL